jgi:hypothetical protein
MSSSVAMSTEISVDLLKFLSGKEEIIIFERHL